MYTRSAIRCIASVELRFCGARQTARMILPIRRLRLFRDTNENPVIYQEKYTKYRNNINVLSTRRRSRVKVLKIHHSKSNGSIFSRRVETCESGRICWVGRFSGLYDGYFFLTLSNYATYALRQIERYPSHPQRLTRQALYVPFPPRRYYTRRANGYNIIPQSRIPSGILFILICRGIG